MALASRGVRSGATLAAMDTVAKPRGHCDARRRGACEFAAKLLACDSSHSLGRETTSETAVMVLLSRLYPHRHLLLPSTAFALLLAVHPIVAVLPSSKQQARERARLCEQACRVLSVTSC